MGKLKSLTLHERIKIEQLLTKDVSLSYIARFLDRGKNTVVQEVRRNGGRFSYSAKKAQERADEVRAEGYLRLSQNNKAKQFKSKLAKIHDIENLQMQIDILVDEIKLLKQTMEKK